MNPVETVLDNDLADACDDLLHTSSFVLFDLIKLMIAENEKDMIELLVHASQKELVGALEGIADVAGEESLPGTWE
jgi:hypothetical protein